MVLYVSSHDEIGQAFRIAISQGLHRELIGGDLTPDQADRYRAVWWTIYILDRRFSSLMGAPNSIQDEDITVPLPESGHNTHIAKALRVHVALSRLLAKVLGSKYFTWT